MHPGRCPSQDGSPESLEARLRALPAPPVPAELEARRLVAIPASPHSPLAGEGTKRGRRWVGVVGVLAAACLLAVLAWLGRDATKPAPSPPTRESTHQVAPQPPDDVPRISALREARRASDEAEMPAFTWPLEETSPLTVLTSIPPD